MSVLTASWPPFPGKAGIANGSSLNDVTEMDCNSSAIDDLMKEVSLHCGCLAGGGLMSNCLIAFVAFLKLGLQSTGEQHWVLQLIHVSQHMVVMNTSCFICIRASETFAGGWRLVCSSDPLLGRVALGCFCSVALEGVI